MAEQVINPYRNANFKVEIEGLNLGGFSEVSGLDVETEVETVREGGVNYTEHKFVGQTSYSDLVLRNGVAESQVLYDWYEKLINGKVERKKGTVFLCDHTNKPVMWWNFENAWPKSWKGPGLNAVNDSVAIQELVIVHSGISKPNYAKTQANSGGAR